MSEIIIVIQPIKMLCLLELFFDSSKHIYLKTIRVCLKLTMQTIEGREREKMETERDKYSNKFKITTYDTDKAS